MAKIGPIELPLNHVTVIRNDDMGVFDLICDLKVPTLVSAIEQMVKQIKEPGLMIIYSPLGIYVLFLNQPPVHWQNEGYKFMAIAGPTLESLIEFIGKWIGNSPDQFSRNVLQSILNLLYTRKEKDTNKVGP